MESPGAILKRTNSQSPPQRDCFSASLGLRRGSSRGDPGAAPSQTGVVMEYQLWVWAGLETAPANVTLDRLCNLSEPVCSLMIEIITS